MTDIKKPKTTQEIVYSKGANDECYTPDYGVRPILPFIPKGKVVWCPFDTEESQFVKLIREHGNMVIASHIDNGEDFYSYEPPVAWDMIVSNPPFTNKKEIFKRALSFNKPFALIMTTAWFNDGAPINLFAKYPKMQVLFLDKRIYFNNAGEGKRPPFSSCYICNDMLPERLCTAIIERTPQPPTLF